MKKKTSKFVYVILVIFMVLSIALMAFAKIRRGQFLAEGDSIMADFCVTMGIIGLGAVLAVIAVMVLLLLKDRRAGKAQKLLLQELAKTPLYQQWFHGEEKRLKDRCRVSRIFAAVFTIPLLAYIGFSLIMLLDGLESFGVVMFLFAVVVIWFLWWISDYRIQYLKSLLDSVSEQLPLPSDKEDFAGQFSGEDAGRFSYWGVPQAYASKACIGKGYSYFRQMRKCRIIRNTDIEKVVIKSEMHQAGLKAYHLRVYYMMEIYINEKVSWYGYFGTQEELNTAVDTFRKSGLAGGKVHSFVTN